MPTHLEKPISLTLADHPTAYHVTAFRGREALNEPFRFNIEIVTDTPLPALKTALQRPAFLRYSAQDEGIHGVVEQISAHTPDTHHWVYRLTLVPGLQRLDWRVRYRAFHDLTVPQILRSLLEAHDIAPPAYRLELSRGLYPPRPLCIQYAESDLQLFHRLCEEEGIYYRFDHSRAGHVLVLADDQEGFVEIRLPGIYQQRPAHPTKSSRITSLLRIHEPQPSEDGRNPLRPDADGAQRAYATQLARRALERLRCRHVRVQGQSDKRALLSGRILQVQQHPRRFYNDHWLITEVHHMGKQPLAGLAMEEPPFSQISGINEEVDGSLTNGYGNQFEAIPWSMPFRPQLRHAQPMLPGYQPAVVVGESSEPTAIDSMGRIRVRLQWPPPCEASLSSFRAYLLCAQPSDCVPAEGSRVLVSFVNNDPNQPVITGYLTEHERARESSQSGTAGRPTPPLLSSLWHWLLNT